MANTIGGINLKKAGYGSLDYCKVSKENRSGIILSQEENERPLVTNNSIIFTIPKYLFNSVISLLDEENPLKATEEYLCTEFLSLQKKNDLRASFKGVNAILKRENIKLYNEELDKKIDEDPSSLKYMNSENYDANKFMGFSAIGLKQDNNKLNYACIGDCGLVIFDKKGNIQFKTPNKGLSIKKEVGLLKELKEKYKEADPIKLRKIIKEQYRNNPNTILSYGALTGDEICLDSKFLDKDSADFNQDNIAFAYTGELENIVSTGVFANLIIDERYSQLNNLCKSHIKTGGSLIYLKK